jgi:hypothetical protein
MTAKPASSRRGALGHTPSPSTRHCLGCSKTPAARYVHQPAPCGGLLPQNRGSYIAAAHAQLAQHERPLGIPIRPTELRPVLGSRESARAMTEHAPRAGAAQVVGWSSMHQWMARVCCTQRCSMCATGAQPPSPPHMVARCQACLPDGAAHAAARQRAVAGPISRNRSRTHARCTAPLLSPPHATTLRTLAGAERASAAPAAHRACAACPARGAGRGSHDGAAHVRLLPDAARHQPGQRARAQRGGRQRHVEPQRRPGRGRSAIGQVRRVAAHDSVRVRQRRRLLCLHARAIHRA